MSKTTRTPCKVYRGHLGHLACNTYHYPWWYTSASISYNTLLPQKYGNTCYKTSCGHLEPTVVVYP